MPETTTEPTTLAEFPMCWYSPSLGFLVPDPMSDDGQGVMQVANGRVMLCLPDDAARLGAVDRLRAELAETRAAGDALAFAVAPIERMGRGAPGSRLEVLITRAEEWRSVRGDAPAEPPADPTRTSPASTGVGWVLTDPDVALPIHAWSPGLIRDELAAKLGIPGDDITVDCVAGQLRTPTVQVTLRMAELIADGAARGGSR